MRAKLRKVWLPYCATILLATAWFLYNFSENLLVPSFWGRSYVFIQPVLVMISVFSVQNVFASLFMKPKRAWLLNIAVFAAWGLYLGIGSVTEGEGQGYAVFGLKVLLITAAPILWTHRKWVS